MHSKRIDFEAQWHLNREFFILKCIQQNASNQMNKFADSLQGKIICKKYQLLKVLGKGAFGVVYKGIGGGRYKGIHYCIKLQVIPKELQEEIPQLKQIILSEIVALRRLKSQHIISYYGHFVSKTNFYIVMEYCNGGDFSSLLNKTKDRRFPQAEALQYFEQIVCAYKEMFAKGVIHRDISLEFILIHNQQLKVADFGFRTNQLAKRLGSAILEPSVYMAPEILEGKPLIGIKAEVYSLGVLLYVMLTGEPPHRSPISQFQDQNASSKDLANRIQTERLNFDNKGVSLSEALKSLLTNMLEYDPNKRLDFSELLKSGLMYELSDPARVRPRGISNVQLANDSFIDITEQQALEQVPTIMKIESEDEERKDESYYVKWEQQMLGKAVVYNRVIKLFDLHYEYELNVLIQLTKIFHNIHSQLLCQKDNRIYTLAMILKRLYMKYNQLHDALLKDENIFKLPELEFQLITKTNQYFNYKVQMANANYPNIMENYQVLIPDLCRAIAQQISDNRLLLKLLQQHKPDQSMFEQIYRQTLFDYSRDLFLTIQDIKKPVMPEAKQKEYYLQYLWVLNAIDIYKAFPNSESKPFDFILYEDTLENILGDSSWRSELRNLIDQRRKQLDLK